MRYSLILGAAALVAANPAPQAFDPNALNALPTLTQGPPVGVGPARQTAYQQGSAQANAAAAATSAATAQAAKRSLKGRTFWWSPKQKQYSAAVPSVTSTTPADYPADGEESYPTSSTPAAYPANGEESYPASSTPAGEESYPTAAYPTAVYPNTTSAPVEATTTKAPSTTDGVVPSSCTPISWTNTNVFTSEAACPTAIEVGTYCGFINPEDPCAPQPAGSGVPPTDDTVDGFLNDAAYKQLATSAKTPSGYQQAFVNLQGSTTGNGYLSYKTLDSYDVATCSQFCDDTDTCTGFNVYIERDPKWNPDQCSCDNPPSTINYKCSIWGQSVSKDTATNTGESRDSFEVVITGSNGYNKATYTPPTPPSCSKPQNCGTKLHDQGRYCMGQKTFPGPFDPSLCAAYAQKQNQVNRKFGIIGTALSMLGMNKGGCVQFQAAYLEKAGKGFGTHCRLFTKKFTPQQATLDISVGGTSQWGCQKSYTWDVDVNASFNWGGWSWK